ncbi:MAG: alanine--tRNA ligase [Candidatus Cyclobacteriaceae bacterium M3_2C_046]
MDSKTIRTKFLEFFKSKSHQIVPSAPLVIKDDPTLMFTNAGMNQFKDFFLGHKEPQSPRIADTQKCLRVSGKHNDLEEVGIDTYHHTMFEMLGNWSFGDYFKKEAIQWAWELLTGVYKLPQDRIYVTVFGGDKDDSLESDQEAYQLWQGIVAEDKILYGSRKDNFWEMGDTGPCGPCSEIHLDLRSQEEIENLSGRLLVNKDHPKVIEIWNLVFIQFNRLASGKLENLPARHVDTGMGFERLCMALQGKTSNYDTDVFQPMIQLLCRKASLVYGLKEETDIALRVIVDHIRAIAFAVADGQLPSNNKAGYVIRRILRRAVRYGYTFLNFKQPFLFELVMHLADQFEEVFPELKAQQEFVAKVILEEEASFLKTLDTGLKKLDQIKQELKTQQKYLIEGKTVFELYDTFGFPLDLTALIARENGLKIDEQGFRKEMEVQKNRSRQAAVSDKGDWININPEEEDITFVGYEHLEASTQIVRYREIREKNKTLYQLVLNTTPFYAESGGQVGDTGYLESDGEKINIINTIKENELYIHITQKLPQNPEGTFRAVVNPEKRWLTQNNHSATHLLHAALREVLGSHVQQRGSLVSDKVLRFDFSHFAKMTDEEIKKVEHRVNQKIRENIPLSEKRNVPIEEAKKMGAMALFGEKYGEFVRVITFDPKYSVELCGGTHVNATGTIGLFKIISESSVAAGVRRIEALTADEAEAYINQQLDLVEELNELLRKPKDLKKSVQTLLEERAGLVKEVENMHQQQAQQLKKDLVNNIEKSGEINALVSRISLPSADALKKLSFDLKNEQDNLFMILAADIDGKPQISVVIADNLVQEKNWNAGQLVRELAREIKGGGGGQPFFATAGGKDLSGLDRVVEKGKDTIHQMINASND